MLYLDCLLLFELLPILHRMQPLLLPPLQNSTDILNSLLAKATTDPESAASEFLTGTAHHGAVDSLSVILWDHISCDTVA